MKVVIPAPFSRGGMGVERDAMTMMILVMVVVLAVVVAVVVMMMMAVYSTVQAGDLVPSEGAEIFVGLLAPSSCCGMATHLCVPQYYAPDSSPTQSVRRHCHFPLSLTRFCITSCEVYTAPMLCTVIMTQLTSAFAVSCRSVCCGLC